MKNTGYLLVVLFLLPLSGAAQDRLESLRGNWVIKNFHGTIGDSLTYNTGAGGCTEFLILSFGRKGRVRLIFTDKKDTTVFMGRVRILKNNTIQFKNTIHEIIYLGNLEKCITAALRIEFRRMLYRTFDFSIKENELVLYYNFPPPDRTIRTITFTRL